MAKEPGRASSLSLRPSNYLAPSNYDATRSLLFRELVKAKRNRALFRLSSHERGFVRLALRLKVRFESFDLIRAAVSVLKKLKELGDDAYLRVMAGMRLAWAFSEAAVAWGNEAAKPWRNDMAYIRFLGSLGGNWAGPR